MPAARQVDLASATQVIGALREGAEANLSAACRHGSIDHVRGPGTLIATGDLHDNAARFRAVTALAGLDDDGEGGREPAHLTLHELIHGDNLHDGMDPSYRVLVRAAALKAVNPERVHVLLANHELSQIAGRGVMKNGVNCGKAFNDAVEYVFGDDAPGVHDALGAFIRSMPLALRCTPVVAGEGAGGDVLCAHSLPADLDGFDLGVLERALTEADYQPRTGAAHAMTWGRNQLAETVGALAKAWGVAVFVLGHEEAEEGWRRLEPCGVILNSDHERGAVCRVDLGRGVSLEGVLAGVEALSPGWG